MTTAGETTALAPRESAQIASSALTIQDIIAQKKLVAQCVSELMKEGEHYGVIPGTEKKDDRGNDISKRSLWKPGADLLCSLFQLAPDYEELEVIRTPALIYYRVKCVLKSASSGIIRGAGVGSCNSREEKYQRAAPKKCPRCGKETIFKAKEETRGYYCWSKKGGCGANYDSKEDREAIDSQEAGIKDPADLDNTILKMALKRSRIDACLTVTGASDFFGQDVDELRELEAEYIPPAAPPKASAEPSPKADAPVAAQNMPALGVKSAGGATSSGKKNDSGAAAIKHDGQYITEGQLKVLHITRKEVGGTYCTDEGDARTGWRKVLQVYRDHDGSRIESSKQLSKAQANHLINRLADYKLKTQANLARGGEVTPIREPGSDDVVDEEMASTGDLTSLEHAAQERWGDSYKEMFPGWLKGAFDYDSVFDLRKQEAIDAAQMIRDGR